MIKNSTVYKLDTKDKQNFKDFEQYILNMKL